MEKIIFDKVSDFILNHTISLSQFGFIKKRSTVQQLLLYYDLLSNALHKHHQVDAVYLDIRKAFDTVPHDILLSKLWNAGTTGSLWNFFKAYLNNRKQCVVINGCSSDWLPVSSGVPQGSILGPLLFILYINDLPLSVAFSCLFLYADDTRCCKQICSTSDCSLLQNDIDSLYNWSSQNKLRFNVLKCLIIHFYKRSSFPILSSYYLNGALIATSTHGKDLGVTFSSDLSWSKHYEKISSNVYQTLGLIRRTFSLSILVKAKKLLYLSSFQNHILLSSVETLFYQRYCPRTHSKCCATKFILGDFSLDYNSRLIYLHLLPLMYVFELFDILLFVKSLKSPDPSFPVLEYVSFSNSSTRSSTFTKLIPHHLSSSSSQHSYFNRLVQLWNFLPPIDISLLYPVLKAHLKSIFWTYFLTNFDSSLPCSLHIICPCCKCKALPVKSTFHN